jgi:hypothetical protein
LHRLEFATANIGLSINIGKTNYQIYGFESNGLVEAHLNYGIITWASGFATNIRNTYAIHAPNHAPDSLQKIIKKQK